MVKVLIVLALGLLVQLTQACLLPEFPYGSMRTSRYAQRGRYQPGTIVWFQCSRGYELKGKSRLVCGRSYNWDGDFPKCLKPCPHPRTFFGGKFEPDQAKYMYDDKVYYVCPRSRGKYIYSTCQMNGKWEQASKCFDYCYVPDNMMYHHKPYGKKIYKQGEKIYYECKDGYYKQDKYEYEWATCMAGGKWNNIPYKCAKKCVAPKYMDYHHIAYAKKMYMDGEYIKYMCKDGYYKDHFKYGYDKAMCKYDGSWDKAPYKCMKRCKAPDHMDYYHIPYAKKIYVDGEYIKYMCKDGYYKDHFKYGYDKAMCKYDGSWDKAPYKCMKRCNAPDHMDYYHIPYAKKIYVDGEYIKYMCKDGYYKDHFKYGYDKAMCKYDGSWDKAPYKCMKKCKAPDHIDYHHMPYAKKMYLSGQYIKYVCKDGYYKDDFKYGYDKAMCKYDGSWDKAPYKCMKRCKAPDHMDYHHMQYEKKIYMDGEYIEYLCKDGHYKDHFKYGYDKAMCKYDGSWDKAPYKCMKKCKAPDHIDYYHMPYAKKMYLSGQYIKYVCKDGYYKDDFKYGYDKAMCKYDGSWDKAPYKCMKRCKAPDHTDYYHIPYAKKIYMDGEYIKYMCKDGYYKDHFKYGYDKAMCKYDGSWDKAPYKCMKKCKAPDHIDYYHIPYAKKMYLSGQYIKYVCKDGYYKDDSKYGYDKAMCKYDGSWDKAPFKCMKKCKAPKYIDYHHMPYAKKMYLSGEYIKYMCKDGYYKDDSKYGYDKALCKYDGSWDKAPYKCSKKCMAPKFIDYHHVAYAKKMYLAGEYIKYVCKSGYYKDDFKYGYDKAKCKYDGSWDSAPYKCMKYCEKPKIDYGMPVPEKKQYSYGSKVSYECIDGYKLFFDGPWYQYSTCLKNGKFDFEPPTCKKEKKNCHAPSTFYYGYYSPQKSTFDYGEYITFYCFRGYQLNKRYQRVRCGVNGVWENILPTCSSGPY